jgi:sulfatase modifying factor 1
MARGDLSRIALLVAAGAGCSKTVPGGGLMVVFSTDGTLDPAPDMLHVGVGSSDGGVTYGGGKYAMADEAIAPPGMYAFPVTLGIDSNGDPNASVSLVASVSRGATALQTLRYVIDGIPTDTVAELDVLFSAKCGQAPSDDGGADGMCCPPECTFAAGTCSCNAIDLPAFPDDAGESVSAPPPDAETGARDATVGDEKEGGSDGGRHGSSGDGATDAGACEAGAVECSDLLTPQQCAPDGTWRDQSPCKAGFTYCFEGSCIPAPTSCVDTDYSTCESYEVPGGNFLRGNDPLHEDAGAPATISGFRLDAYELTVWRFRSFLTAVTAGAPLPDAGAGRHTYLASGQGLSGGGDGGVYESGWDPSWNAMFPTDQATWATNLYCGTASTWEGSLLDNDGYPINCVTWYEAYAFCIWDGGFLPSEAEWNYAAAGGAQQRLYPWGSADPSTGNYAIYGCNYPMSWGCVNATPNNLADFAWDASRGAFGQANLAGNVSEWTLDFYDAIYPSPCTDCAALSSATQRVFRGGNFDHGVEDLYTSSRVPADPAERFQDVGFRCARAP